MPLLTQNVYYNKPDMPASTKYNAAFAPCLPYTSILDNLDWFNSLGSVNQEKLSSQIFDELVNCANFYFDYATWCEVEGQQKPKYANALGWLISFYEYAININDLHHPERKEWVGDLRDLARATSQVTNDASIFASTSLRPSFMRGDGNLLKERLGVYWHLYRFQLETRAKRKLTARGYRDLLWNIRVTSKRQALAWHTLSHINDVIGLYDGLLGDARRSNDVFNICQLLHTTVGMTLDLRCELTHRRDGFFTQAVAALNNMTDPSREGTWLTSNREITTASGRPVLDMWSLATTLVFENRN